jgi:hypothetical protein
MLGENAFDNADIKAMYHFNKARCYAKCPGKKDLTLAMAEYKTVINLKDLVQREKHLVAYAYCELGELHMDNSSEDTYNLEMAKEYFSLCKALPAGYDFEKFVARKLARTKDELSSKQ